MVSSQLPATTSRKAIDESININWNEAFTSSVLDCRRIDLPIKAVPSTAQLTDPCNERQVERFIMEKLHSVFKETKQLMKNENGIDINSMQ